MKMLFECERCHTRMVVRAKSEEHATLLSYPDLDLLDQSSTICHKCGMPMRQISWPRGPGIVKALIGFALAAVGLYLHVELHVLEIAIVLYVLGGLLILWGVGPVSDKVDSREDGIRFW